ncbi:MAG: SusC/RagA family TonB-linked outer membrane protein [Bacteroidales bacterium]|nr:SusC/RagA family TonB-linked outer membrane protein [Bacteroidales bacterium]
MIKYRGEKILRIINRSIIILLLNLFVISSVNAQSSKLSVNVKDIKLADLFWKLQKESGLVFIYQTDDLKNEPNITCKKDNVNFEIILNEILKDTKLEYTIDKKVVIIKKKQEPKTTITEKQTEIVLKGTVADEKGEAIPFASISLPETTLGCVADMDGKFELKMPEQTSANLIISCVGYESQTISIGEKTQFAIVLKSSNQQIEEVVVLGYSQQKKGTITGAVTKIDSKKFENRPIVNMSNALQGLSSGVLIQGSDESDSKTKILIRGKGSIESSITPLFIIDGVPVDEYFFSSLNPNDIASISVLKDASSTSIYGTRAANGVIVVTTKKGKNDGNSQVKVRYTNTIARIGEDKIEMMNSTELLEHQEYLGTFNPSDKDYIKFKNNVLNKNINTNWKEYFYNKNAISRRFDASLSGANSKSTYYLSVNGSKNKGLSPLSKSEKLGVNSNFTYNLNDYIKSGSSFNIIQSRTRSSWEGNLGFQSRMFAPYQDIYDEKGEEKKYFDYISEWNPKLTIENDIINTKTYYFMANTYLEIKPINNLKLKTLIGISGSDAKSIEKSFPWGYNDFFGLREDRHNRNIDLIITNTTSYNFELNSVNKFNVLMGQEGTKVTVDMYSIMGEGHDNKYFMGLGDAKIFSSPTQAVSKQLGNSLFGKLNYNYDGKIFSDISIRRDASSVFSKNNRSATFWSFGLKTNILKTLNLKLSKVDNLSVAFNLGTTGNSGITPYTIYSTFVQGLRYRGGNSLNFERYGNDKLKWEKSFAKNLNISGSFFNNRLNTEVNFYIKNTTDLLMSRPLSKVNGMPSLMDNVGELENKGMEICLSGQVLRLKDFSWDLAVNLSYNKNKIVKLYGGKDRIIDNGKIYQVGKSLDELYYTRFKGIDPENGEQIWLDKDGKETRSYSKENAVILGKQSETPWFGNLNSFIKWKNFSLDMQILWMGGKYVFNENRYFTENPQYGSYCNQSKNAVNLWRKKGDETNLPNKNQVIEKDSRFIEDASFVRLKNLTLTYQLPRNILSKTRFVSSTKLFISGKNLITITDFKGYDPESPSSSISGEHPRSKQYILGIELTF